MCNKLLILGYSCAIWHDAPSGMLVPSSMSVKDQVFFFISHRVKTIGIKISEGFTH